MDKTEIALNICLAMIEKGCWKLPNTSTNEVYGKEFAILYNSILENLSLDEN